MIEVNEITFWGLCALAAMGLIRAVIDLTKKDHNAKHWTETSLPPAPEGMEWVLVKKSDLKR